MCLVVEERGGIDRMGQTLGCAPVNPGCRRFINLPRSCIYGLWEGFNDIAEGFGLTVEEFQEIIKSALLIYLNITEKVLNVDTDNVFKLFDDDEVCSIMFNSYHLYRKVVETTFL